jgi:hypothetical protein
VNPARTLVLKETIRAEELDATHLGATISAATRSGAIIQDTLKSVRSYRAPEPPRPESLTSFAVRAMAIMGSTAREDVPHLTIVAVEFEHVMADDGNAGVVWNFPIQGRGFDLDPDSAVVIYHQVDVDEPSEVTEP